MNSYDKLLASISDLSPYLSWASDGLTPSQVKDRVLATLRPHFRNPSILDELPIEVLAHEAVTVSKIQADPWSASAFDAALNAHHFALAANQGACLAAIESWDEATIRSMSEFISLYLMEVPKGDLPIEEFRLEALRNIGGILEACAQPQLKALLHQVWIGRHRAADAAQIMDLKFGNVVDTLYQTLDAPDLVAPPPWNLKLNHWRNIAQHHAATVVGDRIVCTYRSGGSEQQISLRKEELLMVAHRMQEVLGVVRAARSVFLADSSALLPKREIPEPRPEISFFRLAVGIASQGFQVVGVEVSEGEAHLKVQDATDRDATHRGVHASQFVVGTWQQFRKSSIRVSYFDRHGRLRLEARTSGTNCQEVVEEKVAFESLAHQVTFRVFEEDPAKIEPPPHATPADGAFG